MSLLERIGRALIRAGGGAPVPPPEGRSTLEDPATPLGSLDEGDDFWDGCVNGIDGGPNAAGVTVSVLTALRLSAVWRGVYLVANTVAKLPMYVYERDADGHGKHHADSHPAAYLLRWEPNGETGSFTFFQVVTAQAILTGDGYAYIDRFPDGSPRALVPLLIGTVVPLRLRGRLWYSYVPPGGTVTFVAPDDMYHVRGPGLDALTGLRLTRQARDSLGAAIAAQAYAGKYFANGAEPRVIFTTDKKLTPAQREQLRVMWREMHGGVENAHRTGVVEDGMKAAPFGANPEDSQLLDTRKFSVADVANWLGVPASKLGDSSRAAYNSLEQDNLSFLGDSMEPWLVLHEQEARRKLLTEREKRADTHVIEFMRLALMRADSAARSTFYHNALVDGWMNADEVRARENLNPMPGGIGKQFYRPLSMVPVGKEDEAAALGFQRQALSAFLADATVSDVVANLTDIKALVAAVGLPVNAEYVEPYLPVVAASGPLVSGETMKDEDDDIIGGGRGKAEAQPPDETQDPDALDDAGMADDGGSDAGEGQTDAGEGSDDDQTATEKQPERNSRLPKPLELRRRQAEARRLALREATRSVLLDAARRMVKRIAGQAARAAKTEDGIRDFLAVGLEENRQALLKVMSPPIAAAAAAFGMNKPPTEAVVDGLLADLRRRIMATDLSPAAIEAALGVPEVGG